MSTELLAFLEDWKAWVERGAPDGDPYDRDDGLCRCSNVWWQANMESQIYWTLENEMVDRWQSMGLNRYYPWGAAAFERDTDNYTMHLDPNRLAWVTRTIAELKEKAHD